MAALLAQAFLDEVEAALKTSDIPRVVASFRADGWWRDHLVIDEGDFNSLRAPQIGSHLQKFGVPAIFNLRVVQPEKAVIVKVNEEVTWLQAFFDCESTESRIKGFVRLRESTEGSGDWKGEYAGTTCSLARLTHVLCTAYTFYVSRSFACRSFASFSTRTHADTFVYPADCALGDQGSRGDFLRATSSWYVPRRITRKAQLARQEARHGRLSRGGSHGPHHRRRTEWPHARCTSGCARHCAYSPPFPRLKRD